LPDIRADFPALSQTVGEHPLVYLDSAATSLKPRQVIDAIVTAYSRDSANVHRGVHTLAQRATAAYEDARAVIARFIGARRPRDIVFTKGTTEAVNLVAQSWARPRLRPGDEILVGEVEHHSNIVPWQLLCEQTGAVLVVAPVDDRGDIPAEHVIDRLSARTRVVAMTHVSNALGTVMPIADMVDAAHGVGAIVVVDGAQAVPHMPVDVAALGCDFYAFSGHKLYGPTGIGVLVGGGDIFDTMVPYQGGGDMIRTVRFTGTTYNDVPYKFEAGTPHIAGVIGLGAAVAYVQNLGMDAVCAHGRHLLAMAARRLADQPGVRLIGTDAELCRAEGPVRRIGVLSFVMDCAHPHDIGTIADSLGVAIRTGHHCAQPTMERYGVAATARASFAVYNRPADIDALCTAVAAVHSVFA